MTELFGKELWLTALSQPKDDDNDDDDDDDEDDDDDDSYLQYMYQTDRYKSIIIYYKQTIMNYML